MRLRMRHEWYVACSGRYDQATTVAVPEQARAGRITGRFTEPMRISAVNNAPPSGTL